MSAPAETRTISLGIARGWRDVYEFVADPTNLPRWASGLGSAIGQVDGEWIAAGPEGPVRVRFTPRNDFGILDHYVSPVPGVEIYVPMRVVANGAGSEIIFTLFRPDDMDDERFAADIRWVEQDLTSLKLLLET